MTNTNALPARVIAAAALISAIASGATVATAAPLGVQYLKPSFNDHIYKVVDGQSATLISHDQWVAAGSPTTGTLPMQFVKYAWQDNIYAVSFIAGSDRSKWVWEPVSASQWAAAGYPKPSNAGWIAGSIYYTMPDAPNDVYVGLAGVPHKLTFAEWQAAGSPSPTRLPVTLLKLGWNDTIGQTASPTSPMFATTPISLAQWSAYSFAPPRVSAAFPGDMLYQSCTSDDLIYSGPTFEGVISFAQWQQMGMRTPLSCDAARNQGLADAANYLQARGVSSVAVAARDSKSGRTYSVNGAQQYDVASAIKIFYAAALMKQAQDAGRAPSATEKDLIWRAITVSDNAAAAEMYARIGYATGANAFARSSGIGGLTFFQGNWGDTRGGASAGLAMVDTLTTTGGGLNAANTAYLRSAMQSVTGSQRWGAPATSAAVFIKNGWDDAPEGNYMDTVHRVEGANRAYSAAIFSLNTTTYDKSLITAASQRIYRAMQ